MSIVAFASLTPASPARRQPPSFLTRSNARAASGRPFGGAVVSPLFSCRPWLQNDPAVQLGWDHGHYGLRPSLDALSSSASLKQGYQAGVAVFGRRTLKPTVFVRQWLDLRMQALQRGRSFDAERVNPHYIRQLVASHCPVTRQPLDLCADDTVIVRLRPDLDYVAGNLVMMSRRAWLASGRSAVVLRLDGADKARLDVLSSFADSLSHGAASQMPLLVMPGNRLHVRNPVQALQAIASRLLAASDARLPALRSSIPGGSGRDDFDSFAEAFMGTFRAEAKQAAQVTWAIEDSWRSPDVQLRWQRVAGHLDAVDAERIVVKVARMHATTENRSGGFTVAITADDDALPPLRAAAAVRLHA